MPPKKAKGGTTSKKAKEAEAAALALARFTALKQMKTDYGANAKFFVTDPIPVLVKRIEGELKKGEGGEDIDKLILTQLHLTPNDIHSLTTTFDAYAALSGIYLWRAKVAPKGLESLSGFLISHPTVSTLHLMDCGLTAATAGHLARICREARGVRVLCADHNPLGEEGVRVVFEGMREGGRDGAGLVRASFRYCEAGAGAAEMVGEVLGGCKGLIDLNLEGNLLSDAGLLALARALGTNTTLKSLSLATNQIINRDISLPQPTFTISSSSTTRGGAPTLSTAALPPPLPTTTTTRPTPLSTLTTALATQNTTLTFLDFRGNHIGTPGGLLILDMLKSRKALVGQKQAEGLVVWISERMSEEVFEGVWECNEAMMGSGGKKGKKGKKK
ncbi:uncharacterized protein EV422DRAFT_338796 [Fimicolochytrium jonesii]|uniref:uncharacterized protein n=1 Tax=Fimicolochytrium jonesii TaxID=1396493 RepID=UPI0022FEE462|nr:uncharacterized protein EV422DRAFT_338796 [Fimicolochytrium jonesii]KAI8815853.1 hypothetical protein EV422DRAFT_338796 [Fimicolochytrium jonesii]